MAPRILVGACAGVSLLALAQAAAAQDHSHHHPEPTTPPATDPHAGHDMGVMAKDQTAASAAPAQDMSEHDMAGHEAMDHTAMGHAMTSPYGPWSINRDASGTSWQPDAGQHIGVHAMRGDWMVMTHGLVNLTQSSQSGPRGGDKTFVSGMLMSAAQRELDDRSILTLRAMLSPDPLMGKSGYPLLLAAGETADGVNPLVDRQHPHDFFMELSASYSRRLSDKDSLYAYIGLPGEPAFGPPAFMHRMSGMDSPEAPITHHWLDSTHIVFGVTTLGWAHDRFKIETSAFKGREPDEERWGIDSPKLDSWSVRGSWNPTDQWSLQASYARVAGPEQLEPDENETKWSASAIYTRRFGEQGWWASTLAWGRKTNDHDESKDGWLLETAVHPDDRWTVFARAERIETDELVPGVGGGHGPVYTVGKASLGLVHDWRLSRHVRFGLGGLYAVNRVPDALEPIYGGDPDGGMIFIRLKID